MAFDFVAAANLQSPLRSFHEAMTGQLKATFGDRAVQPHASEVDADTIKGYAINKLAVWPVIATCEGSQDSKNTELRVTVKWAIFIVTGPWLTPGVAENARVKVDAVYAADSISNLVARLAYHSTWGIAEGVSRVEATDLKIHNLGVGLKSTKKVIEQERIGLFVVWGRQEIDMGETIAPGDVVLLDFGKITGAFEDVQQGDQSPDDPDDVGHPAIPVEITPASEFSALGDAVRKLFGRIRDWMRGPDLAELAARRINDVIRQELVVTHGS